MQRRVVALAAVAHLLVLLHTVPLAHAGFSGIFPGQAASKLCSDAIWSYHLCEPRTVHTLSVGSFCIGSLFPYYNALFFTCFLCLVRLH